MNTRVDIYFYKNPAAGDAFAYTLILDDVAQVPVTKTFSASPVGSDEIAVGADLPATLANVLANLQANNVQAGATYSIEGSSVVVLVQTDGAIEVTDIAGVFETVRVFALEAVPVGPFTIGFFTIEIIDTYNNTRALVEEMAEASSLKLDYESGDDLYAPMMPSKISFSMMAPGSVDGPFLHLLTGDEKRYLVKLKNHDPDDNTLVLWQGYILPDLYSEPYKNGVKFIEFTAIDMLASLKGKTFKPWFYSAVINLPELLGYILQETGLQQEMYVTPTLVNISDPAYEWRKLNVNMKPFYDGKKYTDLYAILEAILIAQGMQICSFMGRWFLQGLTRRGETSGTAEVYYPDGTFRYTATLEHEVVSPMFNTTPMVTAETPWKKVSLQFDTDADDNLYSDDVLLTDAFCTTYYYGEDENDFSIGYFNKINAYWQKVGAPMLITGPRDTYGFYYYKNFNAPYNVSEGSALVNYYECREKPYLVGGRRYELELQVYILHTLTSPQAPDWAEPLLKSGYFDKVLNFQFFVNGTEYISNRPSFVSAALFQFEKEMAGSYASLANAAFNSRWTLKWEFEVPENGEVTFRFLPALGATQDYSMLYFEIMPEVLKVKTVGDIKDIESVVAVRDINYTKELEITPELTCTVDSGVKNSFGIGRRISAQYADIPTDGYEDMEHYHYFPNNNEQIPIALHFTRWPITELTRDLIFKAGQTNSVFLEKNTGVTLPYGSLYTKTITGTHWMAAYHGYTALQGGKPHLPKEYGELPYLQAGDKVKMMLSVYNVEDNTLRALWKIHGFADETAATYMQTLAHACHAVRPDVCYSVEGGALKLVWPINLVQFHYIEEKNFIPTRLSMDLFKGKTGITMKEAKLEVITDISYE